MRLAGDGASVPFMVRYRADLIGGRTAEQVRAVIADAEAGERLGRRRAEALKMLAGCTVGTKAARGRAADAIKAATSEAELEAAVQPFKPARAGTLAEQARVAGAGPLVDELLIGRRIAAPTAQMRVAVVHLLSQVLSADPEAAEIVRRAHATHAFLSVSLRKRSAARADEAAKFAAYSDGWRRPVRGMRQHHVLAVQRGEELKVLSATLTLAGARRSSTMHAVLRRWQQLVPAAAPGAGMCLSRSLLQEVLEDAWPRLLAPRACRAVRRALAADAERESLEVFARNLRSVLMVRPVLGSRIMAVDPGFRHGCKVAVIDETGAPRVASTLQLHTGAAAKIQEARAAFVSMWLAHGRPVVAIGNGTACRETEAFVASIAKGVRFVVLNEAGVSVYSVSETAAKELPDYDVAARGAISLARRLQDPLGELIKVGPQHLGVGMYQHSVKPSKLAAALDAVVEDCVADCGVDLNTCSEPLLARVPGFTQARARATLERRAAVGRFGARAELSAVRGIGFAPVPRGSTAVAHPLISGRGPSKMWWAF